jgi:hypothetical protein
MTSKGNRVLRKFFDYTSLTLVPNIDVYMITTTGTQLMSYSALPFQLDDVKKSMKSSKHNSVYHVVLQLKNSNYIYLTGHIKFDSDHFDIYISPSLRRLLPRIHPSLLSAGS